jgi:predicted nucleic acid-binding protein
VVTYVLDASAILRFLDGEAGSDRVAEILKSHAAGRDQVVIPALHWGEAVGIMYKRHMQGASGWRAIWDRLHALKIEAVSATVDRAMRSALTHVTLKIPYVDSFAVELASQPNHILVTADFDFKPAANIISIEFLPTKRLSSAL